MKIILSVWFLLFLNSNSFAEMQVYPDLRDSVSLYGNIHAVMADGSEKPVELVDSRDPQKKVRNFDFLHRTKSYFIFSASDKRCALAILERQQLDKLKCSQAFEYSPEISDVRERDGFLYMADGRGRLLKYEIKTDSFQVLLPQVRHLKFS